jgi:hypothetical protein
MSGGNIFLSWSNIFYVSELKLFPETVATSKALFINYGNNEAFIMQAIKELRQSE